jgi:hypothetical protein
MLPTCLAHLKLKKREKEIRVGLFALPPPVDLYLLTFSSHARQWMKPCAVRHNLHKWLSRRLRTAVPYATLCAAANTSFMRYLSPWIAVSLVTAQLTCFTLYIPPPNDDGKLSSNSLFIIVHLHKVYEIRALRGNRSCLFAHLCLGVNWNYWTASDCIWY